MGSSADVGREILPDPEALARRAAEFLVATCREATREPRICLAGGSTPKRLYEVLGSPAYAHRLPWARVHWFWGDERFVPPDHADSNYGMAREAMLEHLSVAGTRVHEIKTFDTTPEESAANYERRLQTLYGGVSLDPARPLFDLVLLGLGSDGHIASLCPGSAALDERARWATAVVGVKPEARITLTYPTMESTRHVAFLVAGADKHAVLQRLERREDLPAARLRPVGAVHWFLDRAAADGVDP